MPDTLYGGQNNSWLHSTFACSSAGIHFNH